MSGPADALGAALLAAMREATPANTDSPRWVTLAAEARRRGAASTRAFRAWCRRHGVTIREGSDRDAWVSPADVDRAIEGLPVAAREETAERAELRRMGVLT